MPDVAERSMSANTTASIAKSPIPQNTIKTAVNRPRCLWDLKKVAKREA